MSYLNKTIDEYPLGDLVEEIKRRIANGAITLEVAHKSWPGTERFEVGLVTQYFRGSRDEYPLGIVEQRR